MRLHGLHGEMAVSSVLGLCNQLCSHLSSSLTVLTTKYKFTPLGQPSFDTENICTCLPSVYAILAIFYFTARKTSNNFYCI